MAALTDVVGTGSAFVVQQSPSLTDDQVRAKAKDLRATALIAVEQQRVPTDVALRILVVADDRWIVRRISFLPRDTALERGRALGLTAGAILLDAASVFPAAEPQARAPVAKPEEAGAPTTATVRATDFGGPTRYALELNVLGATGVAGPATGFGADAHLEFALSDSIWPRFGGGVRGGSVPGLNGDDVVMWATVGAAWRLVQARDVGRMGLAMCLDGGLLIHDLTHDRAGASSVSAFRFLPGVSLMVQGSWRIAQSWEGLAAVGTEIAFGSTDVWVAARKVGTIPWVRGLATAGVRFGW